MNNEPKWIEERKQLDVLRRREERINKWERAHGVSHKYKIKHFHKKHRKQKGD